MGTIYFWAAATLPWREWTLFASLAGLVGAAHVLTAVLSVAGSPKREFAWRAQAVLSLGFLGYLTFNLLSAGTYIAELYGGLGRGIAMTLGLFWLIVVALTVPLSAWGIAATGGLRRSRARSGAIVIALLCMLAGLWRSANAASAEQIVDAADLHARLEAALPPPSARSSVSLMTKAPADCASPPAVGVATIVVTFVDADRMPRTRCVQAETLEGALAQLQGAVGSATSRLKIDVITAIDLLQEVLPVVDNLAVRPGLDGVCAGRRCFMPWQLHAMRAFNSVVPFRILHEINFGVSAPALRRALGEPGDTIEGLRRIETASFATDGSGNLRRLRRLREQGPELDHESLRAGLRAAEGYILGAQADDGRFEYNLDPFMGRVSFDSFVLARQAGTTLVICELAEDRERARPVATAALEMMRSTARRSGDRMMLHYPADETVRYVDLGDTALATIAFLSCRDLVGDRFDADIDELARFLLAMQRPDGSFYPQYDLQRADVVVGPDPLFAVGQAIFALTLYEELTAAPKVRAAVEAAMDYTADAYWHDFAANFFYMEENWHCLAARAALPHHRHDGYERFCVDYVHYKSRLILEESDGVDPDLVGGYGFGNIILPHSSGSATFGEAASAAMDVMNARGEDPGVVKERLELALAFLLHHQWTDETCFACSASHPIAGAFSSHMASPMIRIDYVQHAMGALGHGGRVLGYVD